MEYGAKISRKKGATLHTPGNFSLSDVKNELIEFAPGHILMRSTYPNGFSLLYELTRDNVNVVCNRPLIENEDGSFTAPTE